MMQTSCFLCFSLRDSQKRNRFKKKTATGKIKNLKLIHTCTTSNNHNFQNNIDYKTKHTATVGNRSRTLTVVLYDNKNTGNRVEVLSQKNRTTNVSIKQWRDQCVPGSPLNFTKLLQPSVSAMVQMDPVLSESWSLNCSQLKFRGGIRIYFIF